VLIGTYGSRQGASISDDAEPHNHVSGATAFYVIVLARQVAKLLQVCANNLLPTASLQSAHNGVLFLPEVAFFIVATFSKQSDQMRSDRVCGGSFRFIAKH